MELAGLAIGIVGVLPVIANVAEGYRMLVQFGHMKRSMAELRGELETESIRLRNIFEKVLGDAFPALDFQSFTLLEPQSSEWLSYDKQIRASLQESFDDFQEKTQKIQTAVTELQQKLATDPEGKVSLG